MKSIWVKAKEIMEHTGQDKFWMLKARKNGWVKFKKDETGFWYDIKSIDQVFIKKQVA